MRHLLLLISFSMSCWLTSGQVVLSYEFNNSLNETNGLGPALTILGTEGIFVEDTLNEIGSSTKWVYRFDINCGLQFNNTQADGFLGKSYTIELYFLFDELTSWKRVVDWKNRKTDNGAYVYYGQLNFYPYIYSEEAPVLPGEYTYYVVTRDSVSQEVILYTDGLNQIQFTDEYSDAILDNEQVLNFFHDDLVVPDEASSGTVAMLKLYNYVLDTATIRQHFQNLTSQVYGISESDAPHSLNVFPNPASDILHVGFSDMRDKETCLIRLSTLSGKKLISQVTSGDKIAVIDITRLINGCYILEVSTRTNQFHEKVIIQH
ncbi:MAG: T9SS type A sorting domain-containing protein [Bacteroidetes bacterium]|nr:T9SS type A sorting domain-containing protein [Bacteroidota bacterium]